MCRSSKHQRKRSRRQASYEKLRPVENEAGLDGWWSNYGEEHEDAEASGGDWDDAAEVCERYEQRGPSLHEGLGGPEIT